MKNVVIFGGTTEGRQLVEGLADGSQLNIYVCVATAYGAELLPQKVNVKSVIGRMDQQEMERFLAEIVPSYCVDATHPYAVEVSKNIRQACKITSTKYLRVDRDEELMFTGTDTVNNSSQRLPLFLCPSVEHAVEYLQSTEGVIFVSTGSKELDKYTVIPDYQERIIARVLPTPEVLEKCTALGLDDAHVIGMQGPFTEEQNYEMFTACNAKWLVTKSSGKAGGYAEKCEAALQAGMGIIVIGRPEEEEFVETVTVEEAIERVRNV